MTLGRKFLLALGPFIVISTAGTVVYYLALQQGERAFRQAVGETGTLADAAERLAGDVVRVSNSVLTYLDEPSAERRQQAENARSQLWRGKTQYDQLARNDDNREGRIDVARKFESFGALAIALMEHRDRGTPLEQKAREAALQARNQVLALGERKEISLARLRELTIAVEKLSAGESEELHWREVLDRLRAQADAATAAEIAKADNLISDLEQAAQANRTEQAATQRDLSAFLKLREELQDLPGFQVSGATVVSREQAMASARHGMTLVWIIAILQCTAGVFAVLMLSRGVRRRIGQLASGTRAISAGDLGARVAESGSDELTELARQFNDMANQLERTTVSRAKLEEQEAALRLTEQRLRLLVERLKDCAIFMVGSSGIISSWNAGAERLYGYREDEAVGCPFQMLDDDQLQDQPVSHFLDLALNNGGHAFDGQQRRRDGSTFAAEISITPLDAVKGQLEYVVLVRDVTSQRAADMDRQRHLDQLAHVGRLSVMGEMAAGLAHELNQPLGAISNYAEGCLLRLIEGALRPELLQEILERIAAEAQRAGDIIHRLRAFARKEERHNEPVDVASAIDHVVALVQHDAAHQGVDFIIDVAKHLPIIGGDPVQIEQVLVNLLRNALDAIRSDSQEDHDKQIVLSASTNDDGDVHIAVRDTGCGVSDGEEAKLFDAFYTTKKEGLGMGLAISRTIVEAHGGRIWLTRNLDRGLTAHLTLSPRPIAAEAVGLPAVDDSETSPEVPPKVAL